MHKDVLASKLAWLQYSTVFDEVMHVTHLATALVHNTPFKSFLTINGFQFGKRRLLCN